MSGFVISVGAIYALLVLNFYNESGGYIKFHTPTYPLWKTTPVLFLGLVSFLYSYTSKRREFLLVGAGLTFGALGDYLIGVSQDGIITGAISFGIGHLFYIYCYFKNLQVHIPTTVVMVIWGAIASHICLLPMLAQHTIPVIILSVYSAVLMFSVIIAISQYLDQPKKLNDQALFKRALGFLLFFISDSLLIFHHTGHNIPFAEFLILNSYFSAQFLIFHSFVVSLQKSEKRKIY